MVGDTGVLCHGRSTFTNRNGGWQTYLFFGGGWQTYLFLGGSQTAGSCRRDLGLLWPPHQAASGGATRCPQLLRVLPCRSGKPEGRGWGRLWEALRLSEAEGGRLPSNALVWRRKKLGAWAEVLTFSSNASVWTSKKCFEFQSFFSVVLNFRLALRFGNFSCRELGQRCWHWAQMSVFELQSFFSRTSFSACLMRWHCCWLTGWWVIQVHQTYFLELDMSCNHTVFKFRLNRYRLSLQNSIRCCHAEPTDRNDIGHAKEAAYSGIYPGALLLLGAKGFGWSHLVMIEHWQCGGDFFVPIFEFSLWKKGAGNLFHKKLFFELHHRDMWTSSPRPFLTPA